jgi:hypothetical protein
MGLEAGTSIAALNSSWPLGADVKSQGDDHIRLIKAALKTTFPGAAAAGFVTPITATEAELNRVSGVTSAIQTQIDTKAAKGANTDITSLAPSGTITTGGAITASSGGISATTGNITAVAGQLISTQTGSATTGAGQVFLNGTTSNRIDFNATGAATPSITTRSVGTKIVLNPSLSGAAVDYAIGYESGFLWQSVATTSQGFKWYAGTTLVSSLTGLGVFTTTGGIICGGFITSNNATSGIGYAPGAGGTVTQATSKSTTVTLNKVCGNITLNAASLASNTAVTFTFNNSAIGQQDNLILNPISGTDGAYLVSLGSIASGSCTITVRNLTAGALAEGFIIRFTVISGATV